MINAPGWRCPAGDFSLCVRYIPVDRANLCRFGFPHAGTHRPFQTITAERPRPAREPRFDRDQIQRLVHLISAHNVAWREWFESAGAEPHPVRYEDLAADPAGVAGAVLGFLGLELPAGREILVRHRRLADELNVDWIHRYRAEIS